MWKRKRGVGWKRGKTECMTYLSVLRVTCFGVYVLVLINQQPCKRVITYATKIRNSEKKLVCLLELFGKNLTEVFIAILVLFTDKNRQGLSILPTLSGLCIARFLY